MRVVLLFFLICQIPGAFAQYKNKAKDCEAFKTGDFYVLNGEDTCFVNRTDDRQFEFCQSNPDQETQLIVIWLKDCKYILRDIEYNPSTKPVVMREDIVMTILKTTEDSYDVHVKKKGQLKILLTVYRKNKPDYEDEDTEEK